MPFSTDSITCTSIICSGSGTFGSMTLPAGSVFDANIAATAAIARAKLAIDNLVSFGIPFHDFRVWDAVATSLPGTAANDDLGFTGGTWGTNTPHLTSGDFEGASITRRATAVFWMPDNFVVNEEARIRLVCKVTAVAAVSATVDVEAYRHTLDGTVNGADIVATAAQSINSTTLGAYDFVLTTSGIIPGELIAMRVTIAGNDTAGSGAIAAIIGGAFLLCDVQG
jgi:hypothetical protein